MGIPHLVRVGLLGQIGRFFSADNQFYSHGEKVVCRTSRGLEIGAVMCEVMSEGPAASDGQLLRPVTADDELILSRIDRFRNRAFLACDELLKRHGLDAVLVDVEHLFDGQSLYFYFLGEVPNKVHTLTDQLAETYEKKVRFRKFTETLANGCGPSCGTGESNCSAGGCGSCSVKGTCGMMKQ